MHNKIFKRAAVCCITAALLTSWMNTTSYVSATSDKVVGETTISGGKAVVFTNSTGLTVHDGNEEIPDSSKENDNQIESTGTVSGNNVNSSAEKNGQEETKAEVYGGRVSAWIYYRDPGLTEFEIADGVTGIGDFSFARSGLGSINIPNSVTDIGYAAFYHCDSLQNVSIPESVEHIEAYAFDYTPWMQNWRNNESENDFLVVGDGILLAYKGKQSAVVIPDGVKRIGPYVFESRDDITEVTFPFSLEVIDEAAFSDCKKLKAIHWGGNEKKISDRAFCNTAVSDLEIPESVLSIGLRAFDYRNSSITPDKRVVLFKGNVLPIQSAEKSSMRLANREARENAFAGFSTAYVNGDAETSDSVIDQKKSGFTGKIQTVSGKPLFEVYEPEKSEPGIEVRDMTEILQNISCEFEEVQEKYIINVTEGNAYNIISQGYTELYGSSLPSNSFCFDLIMTEERLGTPISRLGKVMKFTVDLPQSLVRDGVLSLYSADDQGQPEKVPCSLTQTDGVWKLIFRVTHFSPYCISLIPDDSYETETTIVGGQAVFTDVAPSGTGTPRLE